MVEIGPWLAAYRHAVLAEFGARVRFIGIQGSHARGEAGEGSDIDAVLILDRLTPHDLRRYRALAAGLPHARLLCGFVAGGGGACGLGPGGPSLVLFRYQARVRHA